MIGDEQILALAMLISLTFYALMAGADYGGGVWDLFAAGPRAEKQRAVIANAIGPIWEANHVWLILVIVILFSAFPAAFSLLTTVLHIPLTILLFGIVLRGSAFTFRTYDRHDDAVQKFWGRIFSIASLLTPIILGIVVGAISAGDVSRSLHGDFYSIYMNPWLRPFPLAVGFFALVLFAYLAAVYLTLDATEKDLQEDFRIRALISGGVLAAVAGLVYNLASVHATAIFATLENSRQIHAATAGLAAAAAICLVTRRYPMARTCAALQVAMILWGWAFAQYPFLIRPELTVFTASSHAVTLRLLIIALAAGGILLFPSFWYLFKVFKGSRPGETDLEH